MFSNYTKILYSQFNKLIPKSFSKKINSHINKNTKLRESLEILFKLIHDNYSIIFQQIKYTKTDHRIKTDHRETSNIRQYHRKLDDIIFLNPDDKKLIQQLPNLITIQGEYKTNKVVINMAYGNHKISDKFIQRILTKIFMLISLFTNKQNAIFNINTWLSSLKKTLDSHTNTSHIHKKTSIKTTQITKVIKAKNVNSGATIHNPLEETVELFVWRKEEFEKVLVHEMIHTLRLDFFDYPGKLKQDFYKMFNIPNQTEIRLGEAYVETWALILNTIFLVIPGKLKYNSKLQKFFEYFIWELQYSLFQCVKILSYFKFECFSKCDDSLINFLNEGKFQQETSVFSYYIIKTGLLVHLDLFLQYCCNNNQSLLDVRESEESFAKLHKILMLSKDNYLLDNAFVIFKRKIEKLKEPLKSTMRMSMFELKI
jgi:hypothetical protein